MDADGVRSLIEAGIPDSEVEVRSSRHPDDDDHFAAVVVADVFEGESLVDRHQRVYDALGEHMTRDIHAIEIETYTPDEFADR